MATSRQQLFEILQQKLIAPDKLEQALVLAKVKPSANDWFRFFDRLLAWLGGLAFAFAAMFFIAYNWAEIGRFTKFVLIEAALVLCVLLYYFLNTRSKRVIPSLANHQLDTASTTTLSQTPLFVAAFLVGVLMAFFGQTYQTGADPWQLFANWALLITPWVLLSRMPALWLLWLGVINLAIWLYHMNFRGAFGWFELSELNGFWHLFLFNTCALLCWEVADSKWHWLSNTWSNKLIAMACGGSVTVLMVGSIVSHADFGWLPVIMWPLWLLFMYWGYRLYRQELFMLALAMVSANIVIITLLVDKLLSRMNGESFLLIAMMIIAMAAGSAHWLRNIHKEWQS
ncbi:DUF2157 domain-containing protein [Shewanella maritima]|uniref:DUF2157 domain-containing protein n=1 Tax=Shewanella maritima TaxID=2520507 RepID=UPI003734FD25